MFDIIILLSLAKLACYKFPEHRNDILKRTLIISAVIKILVVFLYSDRDSRNYWLFDRDYMAKSEIKRAKYIANQFGAFYFIWGPYYYILTNHRKNNAPLAMMMVEVNENLEQCKSSSESCKKALSAAHKIIRSRVKDKKTKDIAKKIFVNEIEKRKFRNIEPSCSNLDSMLSYIGTYRKIKSINTGRYSLLENYLDIDIHKDYFEKCKEPDSLRLMSYYNEKRDFEKLFQLGNKLCPYYEKREKCKQVMSAIKYAYRDVREENSATLNRSLINEALKICSLSTIDCKKYLIPYSKQHPKKTAPL